MLWLSHVRKTPNDTTPFNQATPHTKHTRLSNSPLATPPPHPPTITPPDIESPLRVLQQNHPPPSDV
ncbi:hypothetical protein TSMEX_009822 [Taenia solium]|eukprot:TsM_001033800 transcript=TsM_001033800 gene=TsM_001033800